MLVNSPAIDSPALTAGSMAAAAAYPDISCLTRSPASFSGSTGVRVDDDATEDASAACGGMSKPRGLAWSCYHEAVWRY